jgi:hypothetical protein
MDRHADGLALPAQQFSHCKAHLLLRVSSIVAESWTHSTPTLRPLLLYLCSLLLLKRDQRPPLKRPATVLDPFKPLHRRNGVQWRLDIADTPPPTPRHLLPIFPDFKLSLAFVLTRDRRAKRKPSTPSNLEPTLDPSLTTSLVAERNSHAAPHLHSLIHNLSPQDYQSRSLEDRTP